MNRRMRLGIDIDDVLYDWYTPAHDACVAAGITNGVEPSTWTPHKEYGVPLQAWLDVIARITLDGTLNGGAPIPGAADALGALRDAGHALHIVTARGFMRFGDLIRQQTVQWLADWSVPHDSLTFSKDKTVIRVDWFADDSEKNIANLTAAGVPCSIITAPHNGHVRHAVRHDSFAAFAADILNETLVTA